MKKSLTTPPRAQITSGGRLALASCLVCLLVASALIVRVVITPGNAAVSDKFAEAPKTFSPKSTPSATPAILISTTPVQTPAARLTVVVGNTHDLQIAIGVDSFVVVSPEIATGVAKNRFTISLTALMIGETILLINRGAKRHTYVIEVVAKVKSDARRNGLDATNDRARTHTTSGSSTTTYTQGSSGANAMLRQNVDLRKKLSNGRTIRVSGEMFKLFGGQTADLAVGRAPDFALNRFSVGLHTADQTIDIFDSQVNISPMSLNSFTMRGFHLVRTPKANPDANFQKKGVEIYAGLARPSLAFFETKGGKIAGAMIPVFTKNKFQARAGLTSVTADQNSHEARGGVVAHADAVYAPTKQISVNAEASFAHGDLSWRARLDLKYPSYGGSAEVTRFARSSPFNSIGAQSGGHKAELISVYWRPVTRLYVSAGYNNTRISLQTNSRSTEFFRSLLFANVSYSLNKNSQINLRYSNQKIETAFRGGQTSFEIETRTYSVGHTIRFNKHLSNTFETRLNVSREGRSDEGLENGFTLRDRFRVSWKGASLTAFLNYTNKTPSLTSLIVRNPQLLPPVLQTAFALDPAAFLRAYRDRLDFLLGGIELPLTRRLDTGVRIQKTSSRLTVSAETRYNAGEIHAVNRKYLSTSVGLGIRLDSANSIYLSGSKSYGAVTQSSFSVSYTHRFGSSSDSFQFSKILGLNRAKVRGRVFYDLNANGIFDAGEPGLAAMKIQVDGGRVLVTDKDGRYEFTGSAGRHRVALVSGDLGVRLLASTATEAILDLNGGQKWNLDFGLRDFGSISGRIFNDAALSGKMKSNPHGIGGVTVILHSVDTGFGSFVLKQITNANGVYDFPNLRPGKYLIEIDPASLPANFQIPDMTIKSVIVEPLRSSDHNVPITAQRAATGVVFIDKDRDARYSAACDDVVEGAVVMVAGRSAVSDAQGRYILRNLPAGKMELLARLPGGSKTSSIVIELGDAPVTQRSVDLPIAR